MLYENLSVLPNHHLAIGGVDTVSLAEQYGTALYVLDEDRIRANCKTYVSSMREAFGKDSVPLFAGKALCFKEMYRIIHDEAMYADVVSPGELFTARSAGFPAEHLFFHGDNKTDEDIRYAIAQGVGYFVVDNHNELDVLNRCAGEAGIRQKILLRITPGIDPHTLEAINTGRIDCQFGVPIETGQAALFVASALNCENLELCGFHSHIGSQIFEAQPFCDAIDILLSFAQQMRATHGFVAHIFNLGGGFGVRYVETDPCVDIAANIRLLGVHLKTACAALDYPIPRILMEPGRSIVADAGLTLYSVGGVKSIHGYRSYVTVDGGMTDNPRYALYRSAYTVALANRMHDHSDFSCSVAGRCCESGDLIAENILLPRANRGDIIAVLTTGAYNFSMASNYNRICRPAVVMVQGGNPRLVVRRQTFEDLISCDL
ncbi:MAG: diaminopimelate decarboxylase [Evtepia sp.]